MATELVKTYVRGLDEHTLNGGIPSGHIVLIQGASGTMKSSLVYYILHQNALQGTVGLYVTLEQTAAGLLEQAEHLGLNTRAVSDFLPIMDLGASRDRLTETTRSMADSSGGKADPEDLVLSVLRGKMQDLRRRTNFSLLAIDSWAAVEALVERDNRRQLIFAFFEWLRALQTTTFIVGEEPADDHGRERVDEEVLVDGILQLVMEPITDTTFQRRIRCVKMRRVNHDHDFRTLHFAEGRFEVARAIG